MVGRMTSWENLSDAQAAALELTVNRLFALAMAVIIAALLYIWIKTVHEERIAYANAYSNDKVKKAVKRTESELDSWRTVDTEKKAQVKKLTKRVAELESENYRMKELMRKVHVGDVYGK